MTMADHTRTSAAQDATADLPTARLARQRRWTIAWLVPLAALIVAGWLVYATWAERGTTITLEMNHGHGLKPGAAVRYRGVVVGEVKSVDLTDDDVDHVLATVVLRQRNEDIARAGSRFWVVRPQLGLDEIAGIETIIGPRYLRVEPGEGEPQYHFSALSQPPVVLNLDPDDLEILVTGSRRAGLRRGAPVRYRQVRIGTVLAVGLTSDGGAVEARVHIEKPYVGLITSQTRFWPDSGFHFDAGITGISVEMDSLQSLLRGGLAVATPPGATETVTTGHRFVLEHEPQQQWLDWQPQVVIGSDMLPAGVGLPELQRCRVVWKKDRIGGLLTSTKSRSGWLLPIEHEQGNGNMLLGPLDMLRPAPDDNEHDVVLEIAGTQAMLLDQVIWNDANLATISADIDNVRWTTRRRLRHPQQPEECIVVTTGSDPPLPLAADRFSPAGQNLWEVDRGVPADRQHHGAAVVSRADGRIIGFVLVEDDDEPMRIAIIPEALIDE